MVPGYLITRVTEIFHFLKKLLFVKKYFAFFIQGEQKEDIWFFSVAASNKCNIDEL
jgi:hypothetical protein